QALQRGHEVTLLVEPDGELAETLAFAVGSQVPVLDAAHEISRRLEQDPSELLVVLGPDVDLSMASDLAEELRVARPQVGVVLLRRRVDVAVMGDALRSCIRGDV